MADDDAPRGGLHYEEALEQFTDPNLWTELERARRSAPNPLMRGSTEERELSSAASAIPKDFDQRWGKGEIIAFGHPGSPDGPLRDITSEELDWLRWKSCKEGTLEGGGPTWYRVKFYTRQTVEAWRRPQRAADSDKGASETGEPDVYETATQGTSDRSLGRKPGRYLKSLLLETYIRKLAASTAPR